MAINTLRGAKKKCVIFDMDGCLVDTERAYSRAWRAVFEQRDIPIDFETIQSWTGRGGKQINNTIIEYAGSEEAMMAMREVREKLFFDELDSGGVELMPGAKEILDYVKTTGAVAGVATSTATPKAERVLKHFGLYDLFDFRVFGDMIEHLKPAPDIYHRAVLLSGVCKEDCITFEDSAFGVQAANAAGVDVIYVPDLGLAAAQDAVIFQKISSLKEGIAILRELL